MTPLYKMRAIRAYAADHLGVRLAEYWLTREEADRLCGEVAPPITGSRMVKMTPDDLYCGKFEVEGLTIKIIGVDHRPCPHHCVTHFKDVNEIYCHDCRTIVGTGIAETHKRNSTI